MTRPASAVRTAAGVKTVNGATALTATLTAGMLKTVRAGADRAVAVGLSATAAASLHQGAKATTVAVGLTARAQILGAPDPITPPERTVWITAEDRAVVVGPDDRVQYATAERRRVPAVLL
ncbi:hypothetical protein [Nocardia sp. NPDC057227]|uniref:hypothetical protein n=1 Tax=Nocardia sp. NPDC057227 TaxID=3346056 RepID=UPI003636C0B3